MLDIFTLASKHGFCNYSLIDLRRCVNRLQSGAQKTTN